MINILERQFDPSARGDATVNAMNTIKECFEVILGGNKGESLPAARQVLINQFRWSWPG